MTTYNFLVNISIRVTHSQKFSSLSLFYDGIDSAYSSSDDLIVINNKIPMNLQEMAIAVLNIPNINSKCYATSIFANYWQSRATNGVLKQKLHFPFADRPFPNEPARLHLSSAVIERSIGNLNLKRILKNCKSSLLYTIHGIANAESYAIDLFWDLIARFFSYDINCSPILMKLNHPKSLSNKPPQYLPEEFFDDMVFIATQEAEHFLLWQDRLQQGYNCMFGVFPCNNGLWQSALLTTDDLLARLTVINLTHEAKGLDTYPKTREKFSSSGDSISMSILDRNYKEEIHHVATGVKWFKWLCGHLEVEPVSVFHQLSKIYFKGCLKPPFNTEARNIAGLTEDWYLPLSEI
mmetsp:Transcript_12208/g.18297  ORF Transcript_12208/g.18297 Transcript_12208/m.18297 type:complete len:350 (+) Transcript_12208:20-1069(+)